MHQPWPPVGHRVGTVCTAPINTSHSEQQHDSRQRRTSSIDAGTVFLLGYGPSGQHVTTRNDDTIIFYLMPGIQSRARYSKLSANGGCNANPVYGNYTGGTATLEANTKTEHYSLCRCCPGYHSTAALYCAATAGPRRPAEIGVGESILQKTFALCNV